MMRSLVFIICIVCVATVLSELIGVGFLWFRGQLTADTIADMRAVIAGTSGQADSSENDDPDKTAPSLNNVIEKRSLRVWDLDRRQKNTAVILSMVNTRATRLTKTEKDFEAQRKAFLAQLQKLVDASNSTSTEQAQGILQKLTPADAVPYLMTGTVEQNVTLLKGLPEKTIAALLQEFSAGGDNARLERGQKIFEAISQGEPKRGLLQAGKQQFGTPAVSPAAKQP